MGILIFEKNKIDLDNGGVTITATDAVADNNGQEFVTFLRNRRNDSGWATTGSTDAANTTLDVEMADSYDITDILLVGHNLKSYTIQYWDGSTWVDFSTAINVSANTLGTTHHNFNSVSVQRIRMVITGTQVVDSDKLLRQLIITKRTGQFTAQPAIKKPKHDRGRKVRKMLSGRANVTRTVGAFSCSLSFPPTKSVSDLSILEAMFDSLNGFLVWLCGGDTSQFPLEIRGYRLEDIYLMACTNDYEPEWKDGHFQHGQAIDVVLTESRT